MDKLDQKVQKSMGLLGAICGSLLIGLPVSAIRGIATEKQLTQTNHNPTISQAAPSNRSGSATSPLNPKPSIFNAPPYNRSLPTSPNAPGTTPTQPSVPSSEIQAPPPEQLQPPSATVAPAKGKVSIRLVNETGANITYQVIGDTNQRSLQGKSNVMLTDLSVPVTVTFKRDDGGLLRVTPQSPQPGILEAILTETTDLGTDKNTMNIQPTGAVFLN
jgi:hypothetical protein